jgi:hypothetical protein
MYLGFHTKYIYSTLIAISFCIIFILYNFVNLPFIDTYHNYRACLCHITQLVIVSVANYYNSLKKY